MFAFPIHPYLYLPRMNSQVPRCVCVYFWCICWQWPSPRGLSGPLWATPAVAGVTEAKTSLGWGVRGLGKFLEVSENCRATPGSLLVHSWGPRVKESGTRGRREEGLQGHGHMLDLPDWPYYTLHILPAACSIYSFCIWTCTSFNWALRNVGDRRERVCVTSIFGIVLSLS